MTNSARVDPPWSFEEWRLQARAAWCAEIAPEMIHWNAGDDGGLLPGAPLSALPARRGSPRIASEFLALASAVICHRDADRFALLYRMLWRIGSGERGLLERATDVDVHRAGEWRKAVQRDSHKMKAFVRFREVPGVLNSFVAWFEPDHFIVDRVAPFFVRRFAGMRWAILTPYRSAAWSGSELTLADGGSRADAPAEDAREVLWQTYYENIFNPARLNPAMMQKEMPQKYWKHLPEAQLLPRLIGDSGQRVAAMAEREAQAPRRRLPSPRKALPPPAPVATRIEELRAEASACRRCPLWQPATQTVFGVGPRDARVMLIGEQPGDEEDLSGRPFVGPAGKLLDRVLADAGLDRAGFYLTNAVKHFGFEQRGKHRLHKNPLRSHEIACATWLDREIDMIDPRIVVCLGATAARAVFGSAARVMQQRGEWHVLRDDRRARVSVHPAWVLRQRTPAAREAAYADMLTDFRAIAADV